MRDFPTRADLVPWPSARETSDFDESLAIVGRHGAGLLFLHASRLRLVLGHDWRRRPDGRFEPHANSRNLVTGRRTIPWMHHPFGPHVLVPRADDRCDLYVICGTFGPRHQWGDGVEANYPQYGILKCAKDRAGRIWEDGIALEVEATSTDAAGRATRQAFRESDWTFRHEPGCVTFRLAAGDADAASPAAPIREVALAIAPARPAEARVRLVVRAPDRPSTIVARATARFLLRRVLLPDPSFRETIDVLAAPFGYGNFVESTLVPVLEPSGVRFESASGDGVAPYLRCGSRPSAILAGAADACSEDLAALGPIDATLRGPCFDARVEAATRALAPGETAEIEFLLGAEIAGEERAAPRPFAEAAREAAADLEGSDALRIRTGDRYVDGYARFALATARSLIWPNGVIATGALGYGGMSHVAQDVPFFYPIALYDGHAAFRDAAARNLDVVFESPSRADGAGDGIMDHPCDGLDFSFLAFDPRRARVWKARGGAGFFRQVVSLARYWAWTADDERALRHATVALETYFAHYHPYSVKSPAWREGEETQDRLYVHLAAPPALDALVAMARATHRDADTERIAADRARVVAALNSPFEEGGFVTTRPHRSAEGEVFPAGLVVNPDYVRKGGVWDTFDAPLFNGVALLSGALTEEVRCSIAEHFAALEKSPWFVPGAGFAKRHGGQWGVWHWHNAVLAHGLFAAGEPDAAFELLRLMGRGVVDVNGIGCPGEETNGGSYAMAIGCLGIVAIVEGLFGLAPAGDGLAARPSVPRAAPSARIENVHCRGRLWNAALVPGGGVAIEPAAP